MGKEIEYNATLEERVDHTDALSTFKVVPDVPMEGNPRFVPGQYTTIGLNNEESVELGSVKRAMSIASSGASSFAGSSQSSKKIAPGESSPPSTFSGYGSPVVAT